MNKPKDQHSKITLINTKTRFKGDADGNEPLYIDSGKPLGDEEGYTALELFLISFSSCLGSVILDILRKKQKTVDAFDISAEGIRKEEHPTGFKIITLNINLKSTHVTNEELLQVIKLAENYCPVHSMIKKEVDIRYITAIDTVK